MTTELGSGLSDPLQEITAVHAPTAVPHGGQRVLRNAIFLTIGQVIGVPLSVLTNAVTGRYLGPASFGEMYIGTAFNGFGFLFVEWGLGGVVPAMVANDPARAGRVLASAVASQIAGALLLFPILIGLSNALGYPVEIRAIITLVFLGYLVSAMSNVGQFVMLGLEHAEVAALRQIIEQSSVVVIVLPILLLGGNVKAALVGHAIVTVIVLSYIVSQVAKLRPWSVDVRLVRELWRRGTPFVFMGLAMTLQPAIDAAFLSKLGSADAVGWHSAARRLVGFLIFPASAVIGALYPTLCRLHTTDFDGFKRTTRDALRGTTLLVIPVALGCLLYPDIGIAFFDRRLFAQAENNLRVLSVFVLLLYFTMPLGVSIVAAGRQRIWTLVQSSCVAVSLVLDPVLVPWFQHHANNGGLGLCVAMVVSEIIVLVCGIWIAPRGLFDRGFRRSLLPAMISGIAMAAVARGLVSLSPFIAAPIAVTAYAGCLWMAGGLDEAFVTELRRMVRSRLGRLRSSRWDPRS